MSPDTEKKSISSIGKCIRVLFWAFLLATCSFLLICGWVALYGFQVGSQPGLDSAVVSIPRGAGVGQIGDLLANKGLIKRDVRFGLVARAMGSASRLPAGEFELKGGSTPVQILKELAIAKPLQHVVTIPEGLRAEEIADLFSSRGLCDKTKFLELIHDVSFIRSLKLGSISSLEGYLFPDTYYIIRDSRMEERLIRMMAARFWSVYEKLAAEYLGKLSRQEIVTLASLVEKETGNPEERSIIAAVFFNRLARKMKLQSDPTVIYGITGFSGNLTRKDLKTDTPYNTYTRSGLPAGPICNPGADSFKAVFHPAKVNYLYFVSKNDGSHQFSVTLKDHNRAVWKFQKKKRKRSPAWVK